MKKDVLNPEDESTELLRKVGNTYQSRLIRVFVIFVIK
jgi:hypothetical protein